MENKDVLDLISTLKIPEVFWAIVGFFIGKYFERRNDIKISGDMLAEKLEKLAEDAGAYWCSISGSNDALGQHSLETKVHNVCADLAWFMQVNSLCEDDRILNNNAALFRVICEGIGDDGVQRPNRERARRASVITRKYIKFLRIRVKNKANPLAGAEILFIRPWRWVMFMLCSRVRRGSSLASKK